MTPVQNTTNHHPTGSSDKNEGRKLIIATHLLPWTISLEDHHRGPESKSSSVYGNGSESPFIRSIEEFDYYDSVPYLELKDGPRIQIKKRKGNSSLYAGILALSHPENKPEGGNYQRCLYVGCLGNIQFESSEILNLMRERFYKEKNAIIVSPENKEIFTGHESFCNGTLKPIMHYILSNTNSITSDQESHLWDDYYKLNQLYYETIVSIYNPGDTIWIHDYQLLLLPFMILKKDPKANIGFFLHSSFPSSEIFRCLSQRKQFLEGMLGASLIGFQNYSYARHFMSSCTRILGLESKPNQIEYKGFPISIGIFPIGVQVDRILNKLHGFQVQNKMAQIKKMFEGKKIIIGRDKMSQIKGVLHKLNAFETFLLQFPEWHGRVILIQITSPEAYEDRKTELKVWETVSRINGKFGGLDCLPIHYFNQHFEQLHYLALLSVANLGLITSEREALNTVPYEYVLCQEEKKSPLIISEFSGNTDLFSAAIMINPWDYKGVAFSINEALLMSPHDKYIRHQELYTKVKQSSVTQWAKSFVSELCQPSTSPSKLSATMPLDMTLLLDSFKKTNKRLILLDYDGTLTPIKKVPSEATPSQDLLKTLKKLTGDPKNVVFIISGRDQAILDTWLGHISNLGLSAEHGCFIKFPGMEWLNLTGEIDLGWKDEVLPIFEYYTERTPGSFIEHKKASLTWHYRQSDPDFGSWQAKECQNHMENSILSKLPVEILSGKKNLEVRPISVNKGEVVKRLLGLHGDCEAVFCAGDDKTDEDMFKAIVDRSSVKGVTTTSETPNESSGSNNSTSKVDFFTCTIGSATKVTSAKYYLESPEELLVVLNSLCIT